MKVELKKLRKERNMSQGELADAIGASRRMVSAWERNENEMPLDFAVLAVEFFDCTLDELVGRKPKSTASEEITDGLNRAGVERVMEYADMLRENDRFAEKNNQAEQTA